MKIWATAIYGVVFFVAVVGNSLIIHLIRKYPSMGTTFNLLLINMAVADLLIAIFMMPYAVYGQFDHYFTWFPGPLGEITCRITLLMMHVPIAASIITLTVMAFERFFAIKHQRHFRKVPAVSCIIWLSSSIVMSPPAFNVHLEGNKTIGCFPQWDIFGEPYDVARGFYTSSFVLLYVIPLLIMAVLHSNIGLVVWKRRIPGEITQQSQLVMRREKRQVIRLLVVIIVVFATFWFPTQLTNCLRFYFVKQPSETAMILMYFIGNLNSAINPCLCIALNSKFRHAFMATMSNKYRNNTLRQKCRSTLQETAV